MALATKCPHCGTTFRVASDQLKLRGGIVRCGACQHIFDGNANLVDLDALAAQQPPATEEHQPQAHPEPAAATGQEEVPVYEVDLSATLDPLGILPQPEHAAAQANEDEPSADAEDIEVIDMAGQPDLLDEIEPGEAPAAEPQEDETVAVEDVAPEPQTETEEAPADVMAAGAPDEEAIAASVPEEDAIAANAPEEEAAAVEPAGNGAADIDDNATVPEPATAVEAEPIAHPAGESRPVFAMGSALLSEPDHAPSGRATRMEPAFDLPVDEELVAAPPPLDHGEPVEALHAHADTAARYAGEHAPLPLRESAEGHYSARPAPAPSASSKSRMRLGRRSKLTPTKIAPPKLRVPEIDEPDFVKRARQQEQSGKRMRVLMAAGSAVLALALVLQAATTFRNDLAARFPAFKPALGSVCALFGCRVELPAKIENLTIETGDLQTLGNDTYVLSTLLHNQAGFAQAWPAIELALTDANDKPLLRRVFTAADYLPNKGAASATGFGPHAEQPVKLTFRLDQLKPSGYHIAVFYP